MGLFGLFKSKPADPRAWTELWSLLAVLGPSMDRADPRAWRTAAAAQKDADLRKATDQLAEAYGMLNTEQIARYARMPFTGPGRPFEYRRFLRVIDAVVLAGPDAVARVAADASAVRGYDTAPSLEPAAFYDESLPDTAPLLAMLTTLRPGQLGMWVLRLPHYGPAASWPSITGGTPQLMRADPSVPWLECEVELDDDGDPEAPGSWERCGYQAAKLLFTALGPEPELVAPGLRAVMVEVTPPDLGEEPDIDGGAASLAVELTGPETEVTDPQRRIDLLVRRSAAAMLGLTLTSQAREVLSELAGAR
jgi:hypothetical protein